MWFALLLSLTLGSESASRAELADAVKLYYDGGRSAAAGVFELLYLERPYDDDLAWWVARARVDRGDAAAALPVLEGRQGRNLPTWRFQVLEATARLLLGQRDLALHLLEAAWPQVQGTAERPAVAAALGLMRAEAGHDAEAAQVLVLAGAEPQLALDPALVGHLEEAVVFDVQGSHRGQLDVTVRDGIWRLNLVTGLARRGPEQALQGPPSWRSDSSPRGRPDACPGTTAVVWTSPSEGLAGALPGLYRGAGSAVTRLAMTPPGTVDLSPACLGNQVWFVRRLGDHAGVMRLDGQALREVDTGPGAVATVDARTGRGGKPELVLGLIVDGRPGVWWQPAGVDAPTLLIVDKRPLLAPRWVD